MNSRTAFFAGLTLALLIAPVSRGQTVEYTIPTDYELIPGHLSVTFGDTVSAASATAIVFGHGYYIAASVFEPIRVTLAADDGLTPDQIVYLNEHPTVLAVQQTDLQDLFGDEPLPDGAARFQIHLSFPSTLTGEAARQLAASLLPGFAVETVTKRPNELIITVDEGAEELAMKRLEAHPKVAYVAYLHAW